MVHELSPRHSNEWRGQPQQGKGGAPSGRRPTHLPTYVLLTHHFANSCRLNMVIRRFTEPS